MKRLKGFITNSSSTSFIIRHEDVIFSNKEIRKLIDELKYVLIGLGIEHKYIPNGFYKNYRKATDFDVSGKETLC